MTKENWLFQERVQIMGLYSVYVNCNSNYIIQSKPYLTVMEQICINASYQLEDIVNAASPGTPFFFQLYANKNRTATEALLKRVWDAGIRVLFLTVDAPVAGKREADEKVKTSAMIKTPMTGSRSANDNRGSGLTRIMGTYIDDQLSWDDLQWLKTIWKGKIILKGVQSVEDAIMAVEAGVDGITLR